MVLVDTSIWIDYFRQGNDTLVDLILEDQVLMHPFVLGELACGNFSNRNIIFENLSYLPAATVLEEEEVISFIENSKLYGIGLGLVDVYLLGGARLSQAKIWTKDKTLKAVSKDMDLVFSL